MVNHILDPERIQPAIEDYAAIGDCASVALISRYGSLDWLCWPRFDSPALFSALLDPERGGSCRLWPTGAYQSTRRYLPGTNVLETTFSTRRGALRLVDFMPLEEQNSGIRPDHEILRYAECLEGEVEVNVRIDPRFDFARAPALLRKRGALGYFAEHRGMMLTLRSELDVALDHAGHTLFGRTRLIRGEGRFLSLAFGSVDPSAIPPLGDHARDKMKRTIGFWKQWSERCAYRGRYRELLIRSALTLKLLTYAPSGAIVAAPTTSLPEKPGGVRNWDYRYCWVRDSSFIIRSLYELGYEEEGEAFFSWLLHASRTTAPRLQVLYDVLGGTGEREESLPHLRGYLDSHPVRVGNAARDQLQLDIYGMLVSAAFEFCRRREPLQPDEARLLREIGDAACELWRKPDHGIWEIRSPGTRITSSVAMIWVVLDRLIKLSDKGEIEVPRQRYTRLREEIRRDIEANGYHPRKGHYVSRFGGEQVDGSLLLLPLYGYVSPTDPKMARTYDAIQRELMEGCLVYRYSPDYDDGLPPGEGTFAACGFWAVEYLARAGRAEEAEAKFEALTGYLNDVHLMSEEIDAKTGAMLGNFPLGLTHEALISALLAIEEARGNWREAGQEGTPKEEAGQRQGPHLKRRRWSV